MEKPNKKLQDALEAFFLTKVADMQKKYHFDQTVHYAICKMSNSNYSYYYINMDEEGVFFSRSGSLREYSKSLDEIAREYSACYPEMFYTELYYGFYSRYKDIVKYLDAKQKEQDDLYRAVARFENRDKPAEQFSL